MISFIYKSLKKNELYLYLLTKDDFSSIPDELFKSLGRLEFVMELSLSPERKLAREDVSRVMASLEKKGFYLQMPPLMITQPLDLAERRLN